MATSTINLYKNCKIVPEKNFCVNNIGDYLSSLTKVTIADYQYQKIELNMSIKINAVQANLANDSANNINYLSVVNSDDTRTYYYFVLERHWKSANTIEYVVSLDSINTFALGTDYILSNKTKIIRQHKDRFTSSYTLDKTIEGRSNEWTIWEVGGIGRGRYVIQDEQLKGLSSSDIEITCNITWQSGSSDAPTFDYTDLTTDGKIIININNVDGVLPLFTYVIHYRNKIQKLKRIVDKIEEGLSPVLFAREKDTLDNSEGKWYIVYEADSAFTEDDPQPVSVYLASDEEHTYELPTADVVITAEDLDSNYFYATFGLKGTRNSFPLTLKHTDQIFKMAFIANNKQYECGIEAVNADKGIYRQVGVILKKNGTNVDWEIHRLDRNNYNKKKIASGTSSSVSFRDARVQLTRHNTILTNWGLLIGSTYQTFNASTTSITTSPFTTLDRTDPKIIKIIELPYCPIDNVYNFTADTLHNFLKLKSTLNAYNSTKEFDVDYNPINEMFVNHTPNATESRNDLYESKLYNSSFYKPQVVYDQFAYTIQNELLDRNEINEADKFRIDYAVSNTSNSRMAMKFPQYPLNYQINNYNILSIDRNNETPIFTSAYFNYLRYGFNADTKAKNQNLTKSVISTTLTTVAAVVAFATSGYTGGAGIAAGVSLATSAAASITNLAIQTVQNEQSIAQKIADAKTQSTSITGSDDLGLFNWYSDNKAKLMLWQCSDEIKKCLSDLFFYCGYLCNYQGTPNTSNRAWFNFVQCEPVYSTSVLRDDFKNDLTVRYAAGVTFLHKRNDTWDWEQNYEN